MFRNTIIIASIALTTACGNSESEQQVQPTHVTCPTMSITTASKLSGSSLSGTNTTSVSVAFYSAKFNEDGSVDTTMSVNSYINSSHAQNANGRSMLEGNDAQGHSVLVTTDIEARTVEMEVISADASNSVDVSSQCTFN